LALKLAWKTPSSVMPERGGVDLEGKTEISDNIHETSAASTGVWFRADAALIAPHRPDFHFEA
jgi:hypothetical protein